MSPVFVLFCFWPRCICISARLRIPTDRRIFATKSKLNTSSPIRKCSLLGNHVLPSPDEMVAFSTSQIFANISRTKRCMDLILFRCVQWLWRIFKDCFFGIWSVRRSVCWLVRRYETNVFVHSSYTMGTARYFPYTHYFPDPLLPRPNTSLKLWPDTYPH